jgi:thioredoxin reductase
MAEDVLDAIIVGGGPAGLSAALLLGRARRKALVVDAGRHRNQSTLAAHGFFTRDGESPSDLLRIAREQLEPYEVAVHDDEVVSIDRENGHFMAKTKNGLVVRGKKLLLATGVRDKIPDKDGIDALFGKSVFVCPYCDGWENRDRRLVAWTRAETAAKQGVALLTWSKDVVVVTDGERVPDDQKRALRANGIALHEERVTSLERDGGKLLALRFESGERLPCDAAFVHLGEAECSPFAAQLGCKANGTEKTGVPGVWIAGDASHDLHLVAVAVAEGVKAACAINTELREEQHPIAR